MSARYKIVMLRHSESIFNCKVRFCGWVDAMLTDRGKEDSKKAGKAIKNAGLTFDIAHTSMLRRAQTTLNIILTEICQTDIPICKTWRLNERHFGALTGLHKTETDTKYSDEKIRLWRRSYDVPPPPMEPNHPYYDIIMNDPRYANGPEGKDFPNGESLEMTFARVMPYWNEVIIPQLKEDKKILMVAHGSSLRAVIKQLDNVCSDDIGLYNLPHGVPFIYELDENLKPVVSMRFLGDAETIKRATEKIANRDKAK